MTESVSGASREQLTNQMKATAELARAASVDPGQVMKDVADNSEFFAKFAKDGGDNVMVSTMNNNHVNIPLRALSNYA